MSQANEATSHSQDVLTSITSAKLNPSDQKDVLAIESSINNLRPLIPASPYILTIPQDVEPRYHHTHAGPARQWLHNTPFDPREHEATQYQTFVWREPGRDVLQLHVSRSAEDDEQDGGRGNIGRAGGGGTGANTPAQGEKKKISLGDYKRKVVGGTPDPNAVKEKESDAAVKKAPAVKGPVERIKADEEVLAAVEDAEDVVKQVMMEDGEKKDLKRKRGGSVTDVKAPGKDKQDDGAVVNGDEEAPAKKARRTSPSARSPKRENHNQDKISQATPSTPPTQKPKADTPNPPELGTLPPKLSPPPPASKTNSDSNTTNSIPSLPGRLSPTIPGNITSTLAARAHYRSTSRSSELSASGPRSASKDPASRHFTPPPKTVPRNAFRANSNSPAVRSDAEERGRAIRPATSRPKTPDEAESGDEIAVSKTKKAPPPREGEHIAEERPNRLLVRFKFKKSQREGVRRILRMRPNPVKVLAVDRAPGEGDEASSGRRASRSSLAGRRDTNAKGVAQKVGPANGSGKNRRGTASSNSPPDRKRMREEDSEDSDTAPAKRRKAAPDNIDVKHPKDKEPSTPAAAASSDLLLSPSSAQKPNSQQLTPSTMRKDVLSAAMKREHSTDSRLNTPPAMNQNSPTVNGGTSQANTANGAGAGKVERQPSNKTPKQQAWEREQKRLETLGRELKHAASDHFKSLSLTHSDASAPSKEQKLAAITALESLLSYMLAFTCADEAALAADPKLQPSTKTWKSLHGFFGFVKRHCEAFAELVGLVCWLGVVFNTRILELTTTSSQQDGLLETTTMMQRAATEADTKLDVDLLSSTFPKTWEGRFRGSLAPASDVLEVGKGFKGLYKLPLGLQSSPLRAARAGFAMLEEWVGREMKEGYEFKLVL